MAPVPLRALYRAVVPRGLRTRIDARRHHWRHRHMRRTPEGLHALEALESWRNACSGETAVILGNGPSLRTLDLALLEGTRTFCLNRGYLLWQDQNRTPDFLVAVNEYVVRQFGPDIAAVGAVKFIPWLLRQSFAGSCPDIVFFEERWDRQFRHDAAEGLATSATVTNTALQLACHMGFATVILLGIDHRFASTGPAHKPVVQTGPDANHFRGDYFGAGTTWQLPDLELSEEGYRNARAAFERAGRRIINATPGTRLDVFETMDLGQALDQARRRRGAP